MTVVESDPTAQRAPSASSSPWAKQRILETADRLFSDEGIHTVGIDPVLGAAKGRDVVVAVGGRGGQFGWLLASGNC